MSPNVTPGTDESMIDLAAAGSSDALSELYGRYSDLVFRVAYRLVPNRTDAEDVLQDVFIGLPEALALAGVRPGGTEEQVAQALEIFQQVRTMEPSNVNAFFLPGSRLAGQRRAAEAYPLLKRAAELSIAPTVHTAYWSAIQGLRDRTPEQKRAEIVADADALLVRRPDSPATLIAVKRVFEELKLGDRQLAIEERILTELSDDVQAEWVLTERARALATAIFNKEVADTVQARQEHMRVLRAFVERPGHLHKGLLGEAHRGLFHYLRGDTAANPDDLLRAVEGMVANDQINPSTTHAAGPIALAERTTHFRVAERIAREGIEFAKRYYADRRSSFESVGEYADALDWLSSLMYDALGWVYFNEGRLDDAERELERAREMAHGKVPLVLYHLGRLAERRGSLETAEELYATGYGPEQASIRAAKDNSQALERLYRARHGSLDGFNAYIATVLDRDRAKRRQQIADTRIAKPEALPAFALERVGAALMSADSLRGKITVINFWGMWCGPCVAEAPELQKFYETYRDDPHVQFLTISNDRNPDELPAWLEKRKLSFPVLIDDGFVGRNQVTTFPTTWFVDSSGRIAFIHVGASKVVSEEFAWRVEMLKGGDNVAVQ
jgi:thiol-disulfide isomerase/thioredoxin